mmetsp:Transcript_65173/g.96352  ORF Transcript_65173/g.96352 Transcript_65173/m.96352 type:complete len:332 (+) Transcript_65173:99-1094(+)
MRFLCPFILSSSSLAFVNAFVLSTPRHNHHNEISLVSSHLKKCKRVSSNRIFSVNGDGKETVTVGGEEIREVDAIPTRSSVTDPTAKKLKEELFSMASATKRGFSASRKEREQVRSIIYDLMKYNPTKEPAASYYTSTPNKPSGPSLSGKWTLIYTDAPDITSLDPSTSSLPSLLPSTAKLGRIGQECNPPFIKNVIEWEKPDWIPLSLPLVGTDSSSSTILQKVCCEASSSPTNPKIVNLKLVGLDLASGGTSSSSSSSSKNSDSFLETIQEVGLLPTLLNQNPIELRGVITLPFGTFEILYLDEELRIIKTGQNYLAVNVRQKGTEEWF